MRIEPLIFLGIVLLVWMIASLGSWLREQIERYSRDREAVDAHEGFFPAPDPACSEEVSVELPETPPSPVVARERLKPRASGRLRYRNQKAARQAMILMTVFGACKALESRDES